MATAIADKNATWCWVINTMCYTTSIKSGCVIMSSITYSRVVLPHRALGPEEAPCRAEVALVRMQCQWYTLRLSHRTLGATTPTFADCFTKICVPTLNRLKWNRLPQGGTSTRDLIINGHVDKLLEPPGDDLSNSSRIRTHSKLPGARKHVRSFAPCRVCGSTLSCIVCLPPIPCDPSRPLNT